MALFAAGNGTAPAEAHSGSFGCAQRPPWDRPDGLLIRPDGTTDQYLIEDCGKRLFANAYDLQSHYFGSGSAFVSQQEAASIATFTTGTGTPAYIRAREGTLYRKNGDSAVWIINVVAGNPNAYYKRYISGARWTQLFTSCGYTDAMIRNVPASVVDAYPQGTDVDPGVRPDGQLVISGGTQFLIEAGKGRPFPSGDALASYNFPFPACDTYLPPQLNGATIRAREGTRFKPSNGSAQYLVDRVDTAYHKRYLSANTVTNYPITGTLRTWPSNEVNGYADLVHVHMIKGQWLPNWEWYAPLTTYDLRAGTEYMTPAIPGSWDTAIGLAEGAWNSAPIWPDFVNASQPTDVEIDIKVVTNDDRAGWATPVFSGGKVGGVDIVLNARYSPSTAVTAHELGHALLLDHDGLNPDDGDPDPDGEPDGACGVGAGWRVPQTIMDYDCILGFGALSAPVDWDWCGVNHRYQSGGKWDGC